MTLETQDRRTSRATYVAYIMGRTARERRRLLLQGSILRPATERLLRDAGISPGMRVLDLGCGIGDVALIAAPIVGAEGEVVGIDVDEEALNFARGRARESNSGRIRFERADFMEYEDGEKFDAIVSRHVLIHTADPAAVLRHAAGLLRPGGIVALQEYDLSFWPAGYPDVPLLGKLQGAMVELFQKASPHANIGVRLPHLMERAGLREARSSAECLIEGGPDSPFYEWVAETVRSVMPALRMFGLADAAGDVETLAERLCEAVSRADATMTTPLIVSAYARKR